MQATDIWITRLKDSSWVTIGWEWLQTLLGRAVDAVLWVTMIFACYQLIPQAPQPPAALSVGMFIAQFVALDIGGLGLNTLARQQGLPPWAFARIVAYCLIGITLVTITYAGIEHAMKVDPNVTVWVEVGLVMARSVMTVLYGQAIHSLKAVEQEKQDRVAELEEAVSTLRVQLDSEQKEVSRLRVHLDNSVSSVQLQMDREVSRLKTELDSERQKVSSVQLELSGATAEVDTLRFQLDTKEGQLSSLKETMASGMKWHESNVEALVSSVQSQLDSERKKVSSVQLELSSALAEVDRERQKVSSVQLQMDREVSRLKTELDSERQKVSSVQSQLDTRIAEVDTLRVQLDSGLQKTASDQQAKESENGKGRVIRLDTNKARKNGQDTADNAFGQQIRDLLKAEPGLSGRAIAARVGCSPTTALRWKELIEKEVSTEGVI